MNFPHATSFLRGPLRYTFDQEHKIFQVQGWEGLVKKHGLWTIKKTRRVYQSELIEVFEDEVIQPDGEEEVYSTIVEKALNGEFTHATSCVLILRAQHHLQKNS